MSSSASVSECQWLLRNMGFDRERYNERSALVLLALLGLKPNDPWTESEARSLRTVEIMGWIRDHWNVDYQPNTRETIRRRTLHQFVQAHLVIENPDEPTRPINSPKWCYQVASEAVALIRSHKTPEFGSNLRRYKAERPGLEAAYRQERDLLKIPVTLPHGAEIVLSAGGQNTLLKAMVEEFCPRFTPGGSVLYIGDAGDKWLAFQKEVLESLGVSVDDHGKMPDLVVHMEDRNWIVLMEAASTHGPVDSKRHIELKEIFGACTAGLVFVSCFPDQATMRRYLADISWETDVWTADHPTHLVHFDGERFLGPYGD
ncbi:MAG: restriction endonuclease [Acidimicrobiaceae bacterium]|nr:restriction endonuclease [Acidimicrobiaceae bacterium]MYB86844.1 restriction endonuclease [Acidimicrobiaceae bacterium]MYH92313.1 restriction endonuclease [Acidimicrobiaceae bacterium]